MPTIADINVRIGAKIDGMVKNLGKAERELMRSGRRLKSLGTDLTNSVSLPLAAIAAGSITMARQLETSFGKIENLVGVTGQSLDDFKSGVASLSGTVGKSQKELSEALFTITSAGLKGSNAMDLLNASAKASVIGMGATGEIAKGAAAIIQAYGAENITAAEAVNLMTKTVREGNLAAEELAPSIGKVLPIAAQLGVSFEEVGANIATFSRLGISAGESVSAMKAFLGNLIKPTKDATKVLAKYGLTADEVRDSIAKNGLSKTLQDLLKVFDGNTTEVSKLFGSIEGLANVLGTAGAQGEEYTRILNSMKDGLDIVDQGFENASQTAEQKFQKALVRLQNASITIGNVMLPIFTDIVEVVSTAAASFGNLEEGTQRNIIKMLAFAAAVGPVIKVVGVMKLTYGKMLDSMKEYLKSLRDLARGVAVAAIRFRAMDAALQATVIGAVVLAVTAAVVVYKQWASQMTATQKAQKSLNEINIKAAQNIVEEKMQVEKLVGVLKSETASREDKRRAMMELQAISPKYFGNLDSEKSKIEDVTAAMESYISTLLQSAKVQAAKEKLIELNKALLDTQKIGEDSDLSFFQKTGVAIEAYLGSSTNAAKRATSSFKENKKEVVSGIQAQIDKLGEFIGANEKLEAVLKKKSSPTTVGGLTAGTPSSSGGESSTRAKIEVLDISSLKEQDEAQKSLFTSLVDNFQKAKSSQSEFKDQQLASQQLLDGYLMTVANSPEHFEAMKMGLAGINEEMRVMEENEARFTAMMEAAKAAGAAITDYAKQGGDSLKELGKVALKSAADFVRAQMMQAVSAFIAKALASLGPLGLVVAAGGSAIVGTLFNKALGGMNVPAFAEGGLVGSPMLAMVGDNQNARHDPEVITPLSKLQGMLENMFDTKGFDTSSISSLLPKMMNQRQEVMVRGDIYLEGDKIRIALDNSDRNRQRTRGF